MKQESLEIEVGTSIQTLWEKYGVLSLHLCVHGTELIFQAFHRFTYVIAHSPILPSLYLRHNSFCNPSFVSPTSQVLHLCHLEELILQPFRHFTYIRTHSLNLPSLYLRHSSFSNPSVASLTSQFILQPFFRFSYVTSSSLNSCG